MPPQSKSVLMAKSRANHKMLWTQIEVLLDDAGIPKVKTAKTTDKLKRVIVALSNGVFLPIPP